MPSILTVSLFLLSYVGINYILSDIPSNDRLLFVIFIDIWIGIFIFTFIFWRIIKCSTGMRIYSDRIELPSTFGQIIIPIKKIKCVYTNQNRHGKYYGYLIVFATMPKPTGDHEETNRFHAFEKKFIYDLPRVVNILKTKVSVIEDSDFDRDAFEKWKKSPRL